MKYIHSSELNAQAGAILLHRLKWQPVVDFREWAFCIFGAILGCRVMRPGRADEVKTVDAAVKGYELKADSEDIADEWKGFTEQNPSAETVDIEEQLLEMKKRSQDSLPCDCGLSL